MTPQSSTPQAASPYRNAGNQVALDLLGTPSSVLDVGSGAGANAYALQARGVAVNAITASTERAELVTSTVEPSGPFGPVRRFAPTVFRALDRSLGQAAPNLFGGQLLYVGRRRDESTDAAP